MPPSKYFKRIIDYISPSRKGKYNDYLQVSNDDEQEYVALTNSSVARNRRSGAGNLALRSVEDVSLPTSSKAKHKPHGLDFVWKIFWVALGLCSLFGVLKAMRWALTDVSTGLEGMPVFGDLGCRDAPFLYNNTVITTSAAVGAVRQDHQFISRGHGVGTIIVADSEPGTKEVKYEITVRSNRRDLLDDVSFSYPLINDDGSVAKSRFVIETSRRTGGNNKLCMKYDVKLFVPPNLKTLHISPHTPVHVQFAPGTDLKLDSLHVTAHSMNKINMIFPNRELKAKKLSLEVYSGWIVGEVPIVEETSILSQQGDGTVNVQLYPSPSSPNKALLRTITGAGRSDFTYFATKGPKRQIQSTHLSSKNGDLYLNYHGAKFTGKIQLESRAHTVTGATSIPNTNVDDSGWTHYVGNLESRDEIYINSRGWTGLYF